MSKFHAVRNTKAARSNVVRRSEIVEALRDQRAERREDLAELKGSLTAIFNEKLAAMMIVATDSRARLDSLESSVDTIRTEHAVLKTKVGLIGAGVSAIVSASVTYIGHLFGK